MNDRTSTRHVSIGIGLLSTSLIMTELILTRIFSVTIWYHFAFLAISVALFGTGVASIALHLGQHKIPQKSTDKTLTISAVLLGVMILLSDIILIRIAPGWLQDGTGAAEINYSALKLTAIFITSAAPFLLGGFTISLAMTRYSQKIHSLYFSDLIGAGLGCLLIIPALGMFGAPLALVTVSVIAAISGLAFCWKEKNKTLLATVGVAMAVFIAVVATNPITGMLDVRRAKGHDLEKLEVEFNQWNSFSMVTVVKRHLFTGWGMSPIYDGEYPEQKTLVIDMNALTPLIAFDGDFSTVQYLKHDLSAFAHHARNKQGGHVCVIGAGGGRDVLSALAAGADHVTGVEINPLIVEGVVRGEFKEFTGDLYNRPDVEIVVDDGRGFIRGTEKKFDLIHLSMVDTSAATAAGAYTLTENNLYTVEAFDDYLSHLNSDGMLSVSTVTMPGLAAGTRLSALAWRSLRKLDADPSKNVMVIGAPWIDRPGSTMYNILVKRDPFTKDEIARVQSTAKRLGFAATYLPGEKNLDSWIVSILEAEDEKALAAKIESWPLDVSPTTDDKPFFFYQNRLRDAGEMFGLMTPTHPWGNGLFILIKVALIAGVMVTLFLVIPLIFSRKDLKAGGGSAKWDLAYVAALGLGFMCVEIGLMQKFALYLGFPTYTLAVVLLVLLTFGGIGSRVFGAGNPKTKTKRLIISVASLIGLIVVVWETGLANLLLASTVSWPAHTRAILAAVLLAPMGFLLGIPFPAGLASVAQRSNTRIPWLWAINSATSVLGSVLATIVSMHAGIPSTLWAGAVLYVFVLALSTKVVGTEKS